MKRSICIHGHFYQPPRENPWLEAVELQDSAYPYHDWNARITAECYAPNASARRLDGEKRIEQIVNNYSRISFNFGPTLLAWLQEKAPRVYKAILQADRDSRDRFGGHGSALAQAYNHMILPLANDRDKYTQVRWGIRDFEHRFGRAPTGMWLAETAADNASLDALAGQGIKFTILSPYQASRVRKIGGRHWRDVNGARVDPAMPYLVRLASGRTIVVFFYDAHISRAVAFEQLLADGGRFATRLTSAFSDKREFSQLVHIATDGESYGHHHRYGEMALAYALDRFENEGLARLTIYSEFLEQNPPTHEAEIHQGSAWSCAHGVERWKSNCGCNSGGYPEWNQEWRGPLRQALDWLRDELSPRFEARTAELLTDPWQSRNDYIDVILNRDADRQQRFLKQHARRELSAEEQITTWRLLELQRHAMLMYTSCGWFFDELSGIETVQVIQYAARALQLANDLFTHDFEPGFLEILECAKSNISEHRDGREIYHKFVKPAMVDREKVGAHYAISSLFEKYGKETRIYSFNFEEEDRLLIEAGSARLAMGRVKVTFDITRASDTLSYAVLHLGDHNLNGGVRYYQGPERYQELVDEISASFNAADFAQVIRLMDRHFGESNYSLKSLFRDEQRKILTQILASTREDLEERFRHITNAYTPLMRFLADLRAPLPSALQAASDFILNIDLIRELESDRANLEKVRALVQESQSRNVALYVDSLAYALKGSLERLLKSFEEKPEDPALLQQLGGLVEVAASLPFEINLWKVQNTYYDKLQGLSSKNNNPQQPPEPWMEDFLHLGRLLGFRVE